MTENKTTKKKAKKKTTKKATKKKATKKVAEKRAAVAVAAANRQSYQPPSIQRIDLPGLSNDVLNDAGTPLLAQQSSNVNPATLFPPPPTPP